MSGVKFPVRVALPADDDGIRRDMSGQKVVWRNSNGWWVADGVLNVFIGHAPEKIPAVLKRLDILERGKAGAWVDCGELGEKYGESRVIVGTEDDAGTKASIMGDWNVWAGDAIVAQGKAANLDEAKAAADHYAAMLYELDGGAYTVPAEVSVEPRFCPNELLNFFKRLRSVALTLDGDTTNPNSSDCEAIAQDIERALGLPWDGERHARKAAPEAPALPLAGVVLSGRWENPGGCSLCDNELIAVRLDRVALRAGIGFDNDRDNTERGVWSIWVEGRALATGVGNRADAIAAARDLGATVRGGE